MGPKMCAFAGAEWDGVFFNWMTPEFAEGARANVEAGASEAGREPPPVMGYVRTAVGADSEDRLAKEESFYRQLHKGYKDHFARLDEPEGTVGVAAENPGEALTELSRYRALDTTVVRGLASATIEDMSAVAEAAAPGDDPPRLAPEHSRLLRLDPGLGQRAGLLQLREPLELRHAVVAASVGLRAGAAERGRVPALDLNLRPGVLLLQRRDDVRDVAAGHHLALAGVALVHLLGERLRLLLGDVAVVWDVVPADLETIGVGAVESHRQGRPRERPLLHRGDAVVLDADGLHSLGLDDQVEPDVA
jgi:hypothetical protein